MNGWEKIGMQTYQSAVYLTSDKIIVVGSEGKILLSTDGGISWHSNNQDPKIVLQSVSFIDSMHGIIGATSGLLLKSTDGGLSWNPLGQKLSSGLTKVIMLTANTFFACGSKGYIYRSFNGGVSWDTLNSSISSSLRNLYFVSPDNGFAIGDSGIILHTTNGGNSWSQYPTDSNLQYLGIDFLDSVHGAICGKSKYVHITSDGGASWQRIAVTTDQDVLLTAITYHSQDRITATWWGGAFFETTNRGLSWVKNELPMEMHSPTFLINGGFRNKKDEGIAIGFPSVIVSSTDSGKSWHQNASCPLNRSFASDIHFFDSLNGYVAGGSSGFIMQTSNGGTTWKSLNSPLDMQIFRLYVADKDTAFVLGWYGWLRKTTDGWKTWSREPHPTASNVALTEYMQPKDIFMIDKNLGYIVGDTIIWRTTDGCKHWDASSVWHSQYPINPILTRVFFASIKVGYILGNYSVPISDTSNMVTTSWVIFKTIDGGQIWDTLYAIPRSRLTQDLFFWDENNGIIICDSGIVMKTSDGGETWRETNRIPADLECVKFINRKVGYISTQFGKLYLTTNGGETWRLDLDLKITGVQDYYILTRISFPDSNTVMVAGYQGMLRKKIDLNALSVEDQEQPTNRPYAWIILNENPVKTMLSCKLFWMQENYSKPSLLIYDILGRPMLDLSGELSNSEKAWGTEIKANVSSLSDGAYLLVFSAGGIIKSERFIIAN
ncbi:MAG: YCF48-related protein [bacterium]